MRGTRSQPRWRRGAVWGVCVLYSRKSLSEIGGGPVVSRRAPLVSISRPVSRVLSTRAKRPRVTTIPLRRRLPGALSNLPGRPDPDIDPEARWPRASRRPYSVLLPVGFAMPLALPQARCALTAPFHPYRPVTSGEGCGRRSVLCGTFPRLNTRRTLSGTVCPWSPDFPPGPPFGLGPSGRPAD